MQAQVSAITRRGTPNFEEMANLILEVEVATRLLYDRCDGTQGVTPLYQYIEHALHEIHHGLVKAGDQSR